VLPTGAAQGGQQRRHWHARHDGIGTEGSVGPRTETEEITARPAAADLCMQ
jgi:hypothetical protein